MMMPTDIGIDLGTASILVYIKGKGVVLKEPSVVAIDRDKNEIKAIGEEARLMIGRTPGNIVAVRPLRQGVISDYTVTEKMLKYFINKAVGKRTLRKPRISVCIPSGATEVEWSITLAKYTELWLREIAPGKLTKPTPARDRQDIDCFLPVLGHYKLTELRPEYFRQLHSGLRKVKNQRT